MFPSDERLAKLTPAERGSWRALLLHRFTPPKQWRAAVDAMPDDGERAAAEEYLRAVIARTAIVSRLRRAGEQSRKAAA